MGENRDVIKILISTDNHLGVWEKDETRKDDSFVSFEEVFEIAKQQRVDMVLLGGDLFHDNKPSRHTVVRALDILARHCLGDDPVSFQVVSDQAHNFVSGKVNFEHPDYNIGLPVFTIHGNHDDPAGAENLSAVDILSSCNLVNYFGKVAISGSGVGKVRISPVLIRKGETNLAVYGLGNLRDERLARLFQTPGCVEWVRPADTPEVSREDWFSLFVLHQNRVAHGANAKNCVREGFLARFLDLIVWGHEHECVADPWESAEAGGAFSVMQPGSSVATALSEGEAKRKHVVLLEIMGQQWRTIKFPLETVRPFVFESVVLAEVKPELDPDKPQEVTAYLEDRVQEMIDKAARNRSERTPPLPLVRLRVDYAGFSTINTQRFGQKFVGKVANPNDMILWQKAAARKQKDAELASMPTDLIRPEALDEARIEDLIAQHLTHNLEILPENDLSIALHEFVEKDNKTALSDAVTNVLKETQSAAVQDNRATQAEQDEDLMQVITDVSKQRRASQANASVLKKASQLEASAAGAGPSTAGGGRGGGAAAPVAAGPAQNGASFGDDDDDDMGMAGPSSEAKPAAARGGGRLSKPPRAPVAGGGRARQAKLDFQGSVAGKSPLNFEPAGGSMRQGGRASIAASQGVSSGGPPAKRAASTRAAAGKAQQKMRTLKGSVADDESGDEVDEDELMQEAGGALDDDEEEVDLVSDSEAEAAPAANRKRGRGAAAAAAAGGGARQTPQRKAPPLKQEDAVNMADSEEEDAPPVGRRRAPAAAAVGGRSQHFSSFGTGSQASKGWGSAFKQ